mmetsp:Transcript_19741/g.58260  ORF Transcript_19741/g.58260 Transcript_19741/m.58260 type:complete len:444 (-) Transcript_19741:16-1347(-)
MRPARRLPTGCGSPTHTVSRGFGRPRPSSRVRLRGHICKLVRAAIAPPGRPSPARSHPRALTRTARGRLPVCASISAALHRVDGRRFLMHRTRLAQARRGRALDVSCLHQCSPRLLVFINLRLLLGGTVHAGHHRVVSLVGLKGDLLQGLEVVLFQALELLGEDGLGRGGGVDAVGLDGDDIVALVFQKGVGVEGDDARLVGLGHVRKDHIHHADEHAVLEGVARVLDNGDHVGALLGHVDEVTARPVRELDGIDGALLAHKVRHVGDGGAGRCAQVEHLGSRLDPDVVNATKNSCSELRAEGVPHAVLGLDVVLLHGDALLAVHGLARHEVLGDESVILPAGNVNAGKAVGLHNNLGATLHAAAAATTAATAAATPAATTPPARCAATATAAWGPTATAAAAAGGSAPTTTAAAAGHAHATSATSPTASAKVSAHERTRALR